MEKIKDLANQLFDAAGFEYEKIVYKQQRDLQSRSYKGGLYTRPLTSQQEIDNSEENEYLTTLKQIMESAAEIKKLLR